MGSVKLLLVVLVSVSVFLACWTGLGGPRVEDTGCPSPRPAWRWLPLLGRYIYGREVKAFHRCVEKELRVGRTADLWSSLLAGLVMVGLTTLFLFRREVMEALRRGCGTVLSSGSSLLQLCEALLSPTFSYEYFIASPSEPSVESPALPEGTDGGKSETFSTGATSSSTSSSGKDSFMCPPEFQDLLQKWKNLEKSKLNDIEEPKVEEDTRVTEKKTKTCTSSPPFPSMTTDNFHDLLQWWDDMDLKSSKVTEEENKSLLSSSDPTLSPHSSPAGTVTVTIILLIIAQIKYRKKKK